MSLSPGTILGSFEISSLIGVGGMGEVYRARDSRLGREVAIKVLPEAFAKDADRLARFQREAKLLAALNHPHIAAIYELGHQNETHFLVMELVEGTALDDRLRKGLLSPEEALPLFAHIAEALENAHEQGIVHRDLKPANIKITPDGRAKVLDFGLAKSFEEPVASISNPGGTIALEPDPSGVTGEGRILGTPAYMSPEQATGRPVDKRTDIWAFGCCLYEALSGRRPFSGRSSPELVAEILKSEPDWSALPAATPDRLKGLLRRCLQKDVKLRLRDIGDARYEISEISSESLAAPIKADAKKPKGLAWIIGAAAAVLMVLGLFATRNALRPSPPAGGAPAAENVSGPITSLAVLPLENLSKDPEQEYFADGMTDAVTGELSKIRALKIISRTSVMQYKATIKTAREIAAELGVQGLIEGTVMREGNRVRISVQLIDGRSDAHLWAKTYDGTLDNVFELHSTVALAVANEIRATVTPNERDRIAREVRVDPEAYEFYLRARAAFDSNDFSGMQRSVAEVDQALRIAPDFAAAWTAKARAMAFAVDASPGDKADYIRQANEALSHALRLTPDDALAHSVSSMLELITNLDWRKAAAEAARSIELNPNLPNAYFARGDVALMAGDFELAREASYKMVELDPHSTFSRATAAAHLSFLGDQEGSLRILDKLLAENPSYPFGFHVRSSVLTNAGRFEEGVTTALRFDELSGGAVRSRLVLAAALGFAGKADEARLTAEPFLGEPQREKLPPGDLANYYVSIGETERALDSLEKGMDAPHILTLHVLRNYAFIPGGATTAAWAPVAESPRYWKLIDRMNFPPFPPGHPGYEAQQRWLAKKKAAAEANAPITRIAVLPFANVSGDAQQEYFVDGMTDALISELAKIKSIKVISRTSAMHYKKTDKTAKQIAQELGVDGLVEGSAMKAGNEVRITAQLIRAATDDHLWTQSYTETIENVLKVQAQVALAITTEIKAVVTPDERRRVNAAKTVNVAAYELYVQGRHYWNLRNPEGLRRAQELFTKSIEIDPNFALGHIGLSETYYVKSDYGGAPSSWTQGYQLARSEAEQALSLDPSLGEAYAVLGALAMSQDWNWDESERLWLKGVDLSPNYATLHHFRSISLACRGRRSEALGEMRMAYQLDPLSPVIAITFAQFLPAAGQSQNAIELAERLGNQYPDNWRVLLGLTDVYYREGRYQEALAAAARMGAAEGVKSTSAAYKVMVLAHLGRTDEARNLADSLLSIDGASEIEPVNAARAYAVLDDREYAIRWLTKACDTRAPFAWRLKLYSEFDGLTGDPRYQALLRRMNFPE